MSKKIDKRRVLQIILAIALSIFCASESYADTTNEKGLVTDANNFRWEYNLETTTTEVGGETQTEQTLFFSFYDKPADATTVIVPSLTEMIELTPNAPQSLDTYILVDANTDSQDEAYASTSPRREATAITNKLDMSNTSKIQIMGVEPIINPDVLTELVFGENMVIGDAKDVKAASVIMCGTMNYNTYYDKFYCNNTYTEILPIENIRKMGENEYEAWQPGFDKIECEDYSTANHLTYDPNKCYAQGVFSTTTKLGAFSRYKLKLTNFNGNNFNYVGWNAFSDTLIEGQEITISGDAFRGGNIFENSNLEEVTINTNNIGEGIFRNNKDLTEVNYGENVNRVSNAAFAGTGLTSFDFSSTNIKTIGPNAFEGAKLSTVNLNGVNRIEYRAFKDNNISELNLPKSINYLQAELFKGNSSLHKLTVAYDTLTSGTTLPMFVVLDNAYGEANEPTSTLTEVEIIAPYAANEEVSNTHVTYNDYRFRFDPNSQEYKANCPLFPTPCSGREESTYGWGSDVHIPYVHGTSGSGYNIIQSGFGSRGWITEFEDHYAKVDEKKNIIAPGYFEHFANLKKITIGEGYEYVGSMAFIDWTTNNWKNVTITYRTDTTDKGNVLSLPSTLRGVGNHAFDNVFSDMVDFTIPENIEFIGISAFKNVYYYHNDVDFPNLVALGDYAFQGTQTRNVHLYDKLKYMGVQVFSDCAYLNDLIFDLDVFNSEFSFANPDLNKTYIAWALPKHSSDEWYDSQFHITTEFGPRVNGILDPTEAKKYGVKVNEHQVGSSKWSLKFGTIKFTSKNKSQLPNGYNNCYQRANACNGGTYGNGEYNTFFGHINAEKIDIGETDWKVLSPRMFVQVAADEVVLPHNLEVIPGDSFSDAIIQKELILPDTVQVIGDAAFNYGHMREYLSSGFSLENDTIKITKLPRDLKYVGNDAFWGDYNLTADLNSPNLESINYAAFSGTRIRDVYLPPSIKVLRAHAFTNVSTLRNITVDFDFGALQPNYYTFSYDSMPQSFKEYAGANIYAMLTMSTSAFYMSEQSTRPINTFYSLFNVTDKYIYNSYGNSIAGQIVAQDHLGKVVFTDKAQTDITRGTAGYFAGYEFDELDLSQTGWKKTVEMPYAFNKTKIGTLKLPEHLEKISNGAFFESEITNSFTWPNTLKYIDSVSFQWAKGNVTNELPEGLTNIESGAFYGTDLTDNLVIPSTVTHIGYSAFNAGNVDVFYDTVTIKPDLTKTGADNQLVHQLFWNAKMDKLNIESSKLVAYEKDNEAENQEFWHLPIKEVKITNLPKITAKAFDGCTNLEKVNASEDADLRAINAEAFKGDEKLHIFQFSPSIKDETVTIGQYAFEGTAFETMNDANSDFDLTAANFEAMDGYAFYGMPKLKSVNIPKTFSHATIPMGTFAEDEALEEATVPYETTNMGDDAFANDSNLARIFIWGNTVVTDSDLEGYEEPDYYGRGGGDENRIANREGSNDPELGYTIPETTDIYAYSVSPTEAYAGPLRKDFEGTFYPLDEVLFITSNDPKVKLSDDNTDFDKSDVIVYGLRRDGIILQSNNWGEWDGTLYPRSESDIVFEHQAEVTAARPAFGAIYDTPVPINLLDFGNTNFEEIDFELIPDENDDTIRLVNVIYTDGYTRGVPDTDIDPYTDGKNNPNIPDPIENIIEKIISPITRDKGIVIYIILGIITSAVAIFLAKQAKVRK